MPFINNEDIELTQKKQLNEISKQLERLRSEQNLKKSFFSKIATWYNELHFFKKLSIGMLYAAAGGLISVFLLIPYPAIGALIGLAVYLFPSMVFMQHDSSEKKLQESISTEILNLENVMKKSMTSFQAVTTQMKKTLVSLEEKNKEQEKNIIDLKIAASFFEEQVKKLGLVLHGLQENQALCGHNGQLFSNTIIRANNTHENLDINQRELSKINQKLGETEEKLQKGTQIFKDLSQHVSKSTASLDALGKTFEALEKTAVENNQKITKYLSKVEQSRGHNMYTETQQEQEESSVSLQNRTLENVRRLIASRSSSHPFFHDPRESKSLVSSTHLYPELIRH